MYIWVLLATFITALYAFNLHFREDVRSLRITPMAEAIVSKVVIQHEAVRKYANDKKDDIVTYTNQGNVISSGDLEAYLPYGFKVDDEVKTAYYCLKEGNYNTPVACNNTDGVKVFFISYMKTPQRWKNKRTDLPSQELFQAIKNVMGRNASFGYNIKARADGSPILEDSYISDVEIKNNDSLRIFIPTPIYDTEPFKADCTTEVPCILHMSVEISN